MKILAIIFLSFGLNSVALAGAKSCKKKDYNLISCDGVKQAKRKSFCWKGEVNEKKKAKICSRGKTARKKKATAKS